MEASEEKNSKRGNYGITMSKVKVNTLKSDSDNEYKNTIKDSDNSNNSSNSSDINNIYNSLIMVILIAIIMIMNMRQ